MYHIYHKPSFKNDLLFNHSSPLSSGCHSNSKLPVSNSCNSSIYPHLLFRWATQGLKFLMEACHPNISCHLSENDFEVNIVRQQYCNKKKAWLSNAIFRLISTNIILVHEIMSET